MIIFRLQAQAEAPTGGRKPLKNDRIKGLPGDLFPKRFLEASLTTDYQMAPRLVVSAKSQKQSLLQIQIYTFPPCGIF